LTQRNKVLITGAAGFIGFHLALNLFKNNFEVVCVDNINNYYSIELKKSRLDILKKNSIKFYKVDIRNFDELLKTFRTEKPEIVIHLAAQAGVRHSIANPISYIDNNINGFFNVLEVCKNLSISRFLFASSSSVYGNSNKNKFSEIDIVDQPLNLYAASKKSNELMAYSYANIYNIPTIGLRFFTVYGPWGRPDMAYFKFTKNIFEEIPINVYGYGNLYRDFTYIDDIVDGISKLLQVAEEKIFTKQNNLQDNISYRNFNIGNNKPVKLNHFINTIENEVGKNAKLNLMPIQKGDVTRTSADISVIQSVVPFEPKISIEEGIPKFVNWYKNFYY
jgi:UDP-glucuronate 4-epimerase